MKESDWFQDLFYTQYAKLCRQAFRYIPDVSICEDLVQECFIALWQQNDKKQILNAPAYLSVAVKNRCIGHLRKKNHPYTLDNNHIQYAIAENETDDSPEKPDPDKLIHEVLDSLPAKCRLIFVKSRLEKKTYQQIADELNLSVKTIENQMGKAIKIIRQYINDHPEFFLWNLILFNYLQLL